MRSEIDSNFIQLHRLHTEDSPGILKWIDRPQNKFTSPDIQNKVLSIMALHTLRDITADISGKWFSLMVDETTNTSSTEQMVVCLRFVDNSLTVHEEVVWSVRLRVNLCRSNCIYDQRCPFSHEPKNRHIVAMQCCDGVSNMSGSSSGITTQIASLERRALYTHAMLWSCIEPGNSRCSRRC